MRGNDSSQLRSEKGRCEIWRQTESDAVSTRMITASLVGIPNVNLPFQYKLDSSDASAVCVSKAATTPALSAAMAKIAWLCPRPIALWCCGYVNGDHSWVGLCCNCSALVSLFSSAQFPVFFFFFSFSDWSHFKKSPHCVLIMGVPVHVCEWQVYLKRPSLQNLDVNDFRKTNLPRPTMWASMSVC